MSQVEDINSGAGQNKAVDASSLDPEVTQNVLRRKFEIQGRGYAICYELDQIHDECYDLSAQADAIHPELESLDQERRNLEEELEEISAYTPEDPDEDIDTSTEDRRTDIEARLEAIHLDTNRLTTDLEAIICEMERLAEKDDELRQEDAELRQEETEWLEKWKDLPPEKYLRTRHGYDYVAPIEDDEYSIRELDSEMILALRQRTSALCSICRSVPRGCFSEGGLEGLPPSEKIHHPSLSSLKKSVDGGCYLCEDVAKALELYWQGEDPHPTEKDIWSIRCKVAAWIKNSGLRALQLVFYICGCELGHLDNTSCKHRENILQKNFIPASHLGLGPEFLDPTIRTSSAKSAQSIGVARSWYQECRSNHPTCRNWRREKRALPTRLIQIFGPDNGSAHPSARLCDTKGLPTNTPYVSLSHCWGKGVLFTLVQKNLESLRQEIPISQLPKTFQDAIYVAFELGISYLWIDSLCIIQDSKEDWTYEAKRMGDVYLHGDFNISATAYENGSLGLFGERQALSLKHYPVYANFVLLDGQFRPGELFKTIFKDFYIAYDRGEFQDKIEDSVLSSRAWVAQERALSPAIIHYTREQIWWECNEGVFSEAFTDSPEVNGELIWENAEGTGRDRIRSLSEQSDPEEVHQFWRMFITKHSGDLLTYPKDRFPAIAGMARILGDYIDDDFIAGFWSRDLIRSLVMNRDEPQIAFQPDLIAPTWSWASWCAGTQYYDLKEDMVEPLGHVHVIKVLSDVPGFKSDLQSTHFETSAVRGLLIKGVLRKIPNPEDIRGWTERIQDSELDVQIRIDHEAGYDRDHMQATGKFRRVDIVPKEQSWRLKGPTHILILAKGYRNRNLYGHFVQGLLVQNVETDETNTFRRIGSIEIVYLERQEPNWDECFGLEMSNDGNQGVPWFEERGLQEIVLI